MNISSICLKVVSISSLHGFSSNLPVASLLPPRSPVTIPFNLSLSLSLAASERFNPFMCPCAAVQCRAVWRILLPGILTSRKVRVTGHVTGYLRTSPQSYSGDWRKGNYPNLLPRVGLILPTCRFWQNFNGIGVFGVLPVGDTVLMIVLPFYPLEVLLQWRGWLFTLTEIIR